MKKLMMLCGLATVLTLAGTSAIAGGVHWSVNVGVGGFYPPPPVYYAPAPAYNNYSNYYAPPVIYGNAVPVYEAPPVYYSPAPVFVYSYRERERQYDHRRGYQRGYREYRNYDH
jgi:hypothetical protein